jgi:hypothetical protein
VDGLSFSLSLKVVDCGCVWRAKFEAERSELLAECGRCKKSISGETISKPITYPNKDKCYNIKPLYVYEF